MLAQKGTNMSHYRGAETLQLLLYGANLEMARRIGTSIGILMGMVRRMSFILEQRGINT